MCCKHRYPDTTSMSAPGKHIWEYKRTPLKQSCLKSRSNKLLFFFCCLLVLDVSWAGQERLAGGPHLQSPACGANACRFEMSQVRSTQYTRHVCIWCRPGRGFDGVGLDATPQLCATDYGHLFSLPFLLDIRRNQTRIYCKKNVFIGAVSTLHTLAAENIGWSAQGRKGYVCGCRRVSPRHNTSVVQEK